MRDERGKEETMIFTRVVLSKYRKGFKAHHEYIE